MTTYYFNINKMCNSNCKFCAADLENHNKSNEIVTISDMQEIIKKNNIIEKDLVILNGGEPTLNPDLVFIIRYCCQKKIDTTLFTNGRKLKTYDYAAQIIEAGIHRVTIPIFGNTPVRHDAITRANGSFDDTIAGLDNLMLLRKSNHFILELKLLICMDNYCFAPEVVEFLLERYDIDVLMISGLIPSEDAQINGQILTKEQSKESINKVLEIFFSKVKKEQLLIDGIPICHFEAKNRIRYMMNQMSNRVIYEKSEQSFFIDCESKEKVSVSTEIMNWNINQCPKDACQFKKMCRMNTLQGHQDYFERWID